MIRLCPWVSQAVVFFRRTAAVNWWLAATMKWTLLTCLRYSRTQPRHSELLIYWFMDWDHLLTYTCAGITNWVDHGSDGGTPGSAVLYEPIRDFHPALTLSFVAKDSRSGDRFQVGLDRGCPCLQLGSNSSAPRPNSRVADKGMRNGQD